MYKIIRKIKLFFAQYGKLLFKILGCCIIIMFIIQLLNENAKEEYNQIITQNNYNKKNIVTVANYEKTVLDFIKYCNEHNTYFAYKMLSSNINQVEYKEILDFKNSFILKYFKEEKKYKIIKYEDNVYYVELYNDLLENMGNIEKNVIKIKLQNIDNDIKIIELGEDI